MTTQESAMRGFGFLTFPLDITSALLMRADSMIMKVEFWWRRRKSRQCQDEWKRNHNSR